jgi:sugar (pentulose or hexulose) kinase
MGRRPYGETLKGWTKAAELVPAASDGLVILPLFYREKERFSIPRPGRICGLTLSHKWSHLQGPLVCDVMAFGIISRMYELGLG